jgi:hypothetical protein
MPKVAANVIGKSVNTVLCDSMIDILTIYCSSPINWQQVNLSWSTNATQLVTRNPMIAGRRWASIRGTRVFFSESIELIDAKSFQCYLKIAIFKLKRKISRNQRNSLSFLSHKSSEVQFVIIDATLSRKRTPERLFFYVVLPRAKDTSAQRGWLIHEICFRVCHQ